MGLVVNNNIPALMSYNAVNSTSNALQKSIQKLSTGLRINSAADDAAGLAISEKMRAQVRGLDQAVRNSQDGISMIQTAEGALNETHSILQRMRELSVQSANDTLTQQDRSYIQLEIDQLREEVTRIGNTTQFNKKKLLDGSAAVLWSSDNLSTKAIVNGGLRQVDQFGQKSALEGNYNIDVNAAAGQAEVQKTDIFKIKHKNVMMNVGLARGVDNITIDNLPAGDYRVNHTAGTLGSRVTGNFGLTASISASVSVAAVAWNRVGDPDVNHSLLLEVLNRNTSVGTVTFRATTNTLALDGTIDTKIADIVVGTTGIINGSSDLGIVSSSLSLISATYAARFSAGAKSVINHSIVGGAGITLNYSANVQNSTWDGRWGPNGQSVIQSGSLVNFGINGTANGTVQFRSFYLNSANGTVYAGNIIITYTGQASAATGATSSFTAAYIGQTAQGDVKLRDLDKFWDAQGRFLLTDPQTITITQGDGKQTSVTLYANDTLNDVASKLNNAISSGLGQGQYIRTGTAQFVTMVTDANQQDFALQAVPGTMIIRSAVAGANGKLSLAGDEDLIKAFSLNTIQDSKENTFTVSITDAHSGLQVGQTTTITGNKLIGVINPNVDVVFDPMANIKVEWDDATSSFRFSKDDTTYRTTLHLADNTTVFQIGANEGEDMGINIGDMRSEALGLNAVLVTDRESAARSITVIDNAIDKVSMQRAKLGAYQNRLEHTINNLTVAGENLTAAESRIRDTDMAKEMMNFTKLNIMLQAGTSMLAQANQLPNNVLGLLR